MPWFCRRGCIKGKLASLAACVLHATVVTSFVTRAHWGTTQGHNGQVWSSHIAEEDAVEDFGAALDLVPLMQRIASHCGTRRGREALLALVSSQSHSSSRRLSAFASTQSRRRRVQNITSPPPRRLPFRTHWATSAAQTRRQYDLVQQATLALRKVHNLTYSPHYGANSDPWDVTNLATTDDDTWLDCVSPAEFALEDILQAEQVVRMLLRVYEWSQGNATRVWLPLLSDIVAPMPVAKLKNTLESLSNTVEAVRVRTLADPGARSSYQFQLSEKTFPVLSLLKAQVIELQSKRGLQDSGTDRRLLDLLEELALKEKAISENLALQILKARTEIDLGLDIVTELDILFAKAAFGMSVNGQFPAVGERGRIHVSKFVHPLLALQRQPDGVVPIDLRLSLDNSKNALVISGMNGGGKTLSLKSFGVATILCKLGVAIPSLSDKQPCVDYIDNILLSFGDRQSVVQGQSTFMSLLTGYSQILEKISDPTAGSSLVLLDELGGGTDPSAGGAIAQAILEKLLSCESCLVVATTHCPRLKALSFNADLFDCASVLSLDSGENSGQAPTFHLQYGVIGESYALSAARRTIPAMPIDVLERAAALCQDDPTKEAAQYNLALSQSLEKRLYSVDATQAMLDSSLHDTLRCQKAMLSLARAYERHFSLIEARVERTYKELKGSGARPVEVVGDTLKELRLAKKQAESAAELLRQRGLKMLPFDKDLNEGDIVVILAEGEWEDTTGKVMQMEVPGVDLARDEVLVMPSFLPWHFPGQPAAGMSVHPLVLHRSDLAVWDYDSIVEADLDSDGTPSGIPESKRRLNDVLATLKSKTTVSQLDASTSDGTAKPSFQSSRERKASKKSKRKR